jgi:hypothetical protein
MWMWMIWRDRCDMLKPLAEDPESVLKVTMLDDWLEN